MFLYATPCVNLPGSLLSFGAVSNKEVCLLSEFCVLYPTIKRIFKSYKTVNPFSCPPIPPCHTHLLHIYQGQALCQTTEVNAAVPVPEDCSRFRFLSCLGSSYFLFLLLSFTAEMNSSTLLLYNSTQVAGNWCEHIF